MAERLRSGLVGPRGAEVPLGHYLPVHNPTDGRILGEVLEADASQLDDVVDGAQAAYSGVWRDMPPEQRGALLRAWADSVSAHAQELVELETADVGHPTRDATADAQRAAQWLTYFGGMADKLESHVYANYPDRLAYEVREPYGVVAGIIPFNANLVLASIKASAALAAGNCFVLKAPEVSPFSSYRFAELAREAGLPPGVMNVVSGRGAATGKLLSEHVGIGMVSFTGSTAGGRAVAAQAGGAIKPVTMELGGKNAVIVLADADLDVAVPSILHSNFVKSGQSCVAGSRVFVHESLHERFCEMAKRVADTVVMGDPRDPRTHMGPLVTRTQRDRVASLVADAVDQGATIISGGYASEEADLGSGNYFAPTVLADVTDDNIAAREEFFAPVASVLSFRDIDEVLYRSNNTGMGLAAQVWGNDAGAIQFLVRRLEAGTVWVNSYRSLHPTISIGGVKDSGFGRENRFAGVDAFLRPKSVVWDLTTNRSLPYAG
ncbi:aldehyde dehydrogenase family protein [Rhodococcus jostii]|uniref:Aldehyde dehydrogenase (NAD+) n=1 Tax=Rhodococcus jostii TaxID=132919 RepID=A0A1H4TIG9_RHOJO|nr:aldehyde dehydrogenase family protein [Rhodococcus jostii]SEC55904.1 aldehyde dehydrogenase (NAD+) [Rhodococcus jostii]